MIYKLRARKRPAGSNIIIAFLASLLENPSYTSLTHGQYKKRSPIHKLYYWNLLRSSCESTALLNSDVQVMRSCWCAHRCHCVQLKPTFASTMWTKSGLDTICQSQIVPDYRANGGHVHCLRDRLDKATSTSPPQYLRRILVNLSSLCAQCRSRQWHDTMVCGPQQTRKVRRHHAPRSVDLICFMPRNTDESPIGVASTVHTWRCRGCKSQQQNLSQSQQEWPVRIGAQTVDGRSSISRSSRVDRNHHHLLTPHFCTVGCLALSHFGCHLCLDRSTYRRHSRPAHTRGKANDPYRSMSSHPPAMPN